ncbi:MAG: endonuclease III [Thermomicrobiales bacterium]|nr:endonuclease III [Thermomicrobiales bacterium]
MAKQAFDIDDVMLRLAQAVEPYPKAALFELAGRGYTSPFEQLVACMISIRTRDETTLPVAEALFQQARTPYAMLQLGVATVERLISRATFHESKARQIVQIAQRVIDEFGGEVPCDDEQLQTFPGVGPKCAYLVLGIACDAPRVSADIHVHRVTNRWGYVQTRTPEQTMVVLEEKLPRKYWLEINRLLVPFGKHICTGNLPRCSTCPLLDVCQQVGVTAHR